MSDPHDLPRLTHWLAIQKNLLGSAFDPQLSLGRRAAIVAGFTASGARFALGTFVDRERLGARPAQPPVLYEFEACPMCRKVRETISMLDLTVDIRPCPKGGERYRAEVLARGGKAQFPYLVDPEAGVELYESNDIVRHLWQRYGRGRPPALVQNTPLAGLGALAFGLLGVSGGRLARPSRLPEQPLELWGFEASPYTRLVRQTLCELELPYRLHPVAKGSPGRAAFVARAGRMQVPWLVDPNTGTALFESAAIQAYLEGTYAA